MIKRELVRSVKPNRLVNQVVKVIRRIGVKNKLAGHLGHAESPMSIVNVDIANRIEVRHLTAVLPHHVTTTANQTAVF